MLLDVVQLQVPIITKPFKSKMVSLSNHEIQFTYKTADIIQLSGIIEPEKFTKHKLENNNINFMEISVAYSYTSQEAALLMEIRN